MILRTSTHSHSHSYLYWTIANDSSNSLHQLNLRDPSSSTTLTMPTSQVGKRQAGISLSSLSLTPALALDPRTRRLWVCDANSGDILSCNPTNSSCDVEVSAAAITRSDNGTVQSWTEGFIQKFERALKCAESQP